MKILYFLVFNFNLIANKLEINYSTDIRNFKVKSDLSIYLPGNKPTDKDYMALKRNAVFDISCVDLNDSENLKSTYYLDEKNYFKSFFINGLKIAVLGLNSNIDYYLLKNKLKLVNRNYNPDLFILISSNSCSYNNLTDILNNFKNLILIISNINNI